MIRLAYLAWLPYVVLFLAFIEYVGLLSGLEAEPAAGASHGADAFRLGFLGPAEEAALSVELQYPGGGVGVKPEHNTRVCHG